jgi:predicted esterase
VYRPVSTQRLGAGLATWTNLDLAVEECRAHLATIGSIDSISSFSLGGSLALRLITEVVNVPVLMIAPSLRGPVVAAAAPNADGAVIDVITGEHDPYLDLTTASVAQLRSAGADVRVDVLAGVAHDFPPDFAQHLTGRLDRYLRRRS